jgi:glutamate formiminotransferase
MYEKFIEKFNKLPKPVSVIGLLLFIVLLYVTLQKVITPFVMTVVGSDFFFEKEEEQEELGKIANARSDQAFAQCKAVMMSEKHVPEGSRFSEKEYEGWALGGKTYLIRSNVNVASPDKGQQDRKYACKIKFNGGDMNDAKNWDTLGVDFNEPG